MHKVTLCTTQNQPTHTQTPTAQILRKNSLFLTEPVCSSGNLDQSWPLLKQLWPVLPYPQGSLTIILASEKVQTDPSHSWRNSNQICTFLMEFFFTNPASSEGIAITPVHFLRNSDQSWPLLKEFSPSLPIAVEILTHLTFLKKFWPLLPNPAGILASPAKPYKNFDQSYLMVKEFWLILPGVILIFIFCKGHTCFSVQTLTVIKQILQLCTEATWIQYVPMWVDLNRPTNFTFDRLTPAHKKVKSARGHNVFSWVTRSIETRLYYGV